MRAFGSPNQCVYMELCGWGRYLAPIYTFGDSVPVSNHPFFAGLTVRQWRKFHWRHAQHHMKQVRAANGQAQGQP